MQPVASQLEMEYPPRGPLRLYRFKEATAFPCFRCGVSKKAKLIAVYAGDWSRRLCNGCYGCLLAVYEIKTGSAVDEEKAESLGGILLSALGQKELAEARLRYLLSERRAEVLSDATVRFLSTAEHVSRSLGGTPSLDWSPAVIGLCKAVELEVVGRLLGPITQLRDSGLSVDEIKDPDIGRVAKFCADAKAKPPELGTFAHFLRTVIHSETRRRTSRVIGTFLDQMKDWPHAGWLLAPTGLHSSLVALTEGFRNRAAHTDELDARDYERCRALVVGEDGLLWRLVQATQTRA
jgi:hypothetical protein